MEKCDKEVMENGKTVAVGADLEPAEAEAITQKLTEVFKAKTDWFYMGGRAVIKTLAENTDDVRDYLRGRYPVQLYKGDAFVD